jgi:hypothetical protein
VYAAPVCACEHGGCVRVRPSREAWSA